MAGTSLCRRNLDTEGDVNMTTASLPFDDDGEAVMVLKPGTHQSKAYTGTAAAIDNPVGSNVVRVIATTACYISIGSAPTATTSSVYIVADTVEYFKVVDGTDKISAIRVSDSGTLHVTDMS
jgi:hypothetical protein